MARDASTIRAHLLKLARLRRGIHFRQSIMPSTSSVANGGTKAMGPLVNPPNPMATEKSRKSGQLNPRR